MSRKQAAMGPKKKHHFVLVHGAGHGAWCWVKIAPLLQEGGHRVTTVDLASAGDSPIMADDITTYQEYNQPLVDLFNTFPDGEKVILVGHSYGGTSLSGMSELFSNKISVAVYLSALMFPAGQTVAEVADFAYAVDHVRRLPFERTNMMEPPLSTKENYGRVPKVYVLSSQDQTITPAFARTMIKINPPDEVIEVNADHSIFFSAVEPLQKVLNDVAEKYDF